MKLLGKPNRKFEFNYRMDIRELGVKVWIELNWQNGNFHWNPSCNFGDETYQDSRIFGFHNGGYDEFCCWDITLYSVLKAEPSLPPAFTLSSLSAFIVFEGVGNMFHQNVSWSLVNYMALQWYLGLRVTWFASALQDEHKFWINFNLIHEQCLAIRVLCLLSVTWSQAARVVGNRLACSVSVGIPHSYSQHFFILCPNVVTVLH
jgi:hypothetical protein